MIDYDKVLAKPIIFVGPGRSGSTIISEFVLSHNQLGWPDNYLEWMPSIASTAWLTRLSQNRFWRVDGEKGQLNKTKFMNNYIPRPAEAWSFWQSITREEIDFSRGFFASPARQFIREREDSQNTGQACISPRQAATRDEVHWTCTCRVFAQHLPRCPVH